MVYAVVSRSDVITVLDGYEDFEKISSVINGNNGEQLINVSEEQIIKMLEIAMKRAREKCEKCIKYGYYHCGICAVADFKLRVKQIVEG